MVVGSLCESWRVILLLSLSSHRWIKHVQIVPHHHDQLFLFLFFPLLQGLDLFKRQRDSDLSDHRRRSAMGRWAAAVAVHHLSALLLL